MLYEEAVKRDSDISKKNLIGISSHKCTIFDDSYSAFYEKDENNGLVIDDVNYLKNKLFDSDTDNMCKLINNNYYMIFDVNSKLDINNLIYPICICFKAHICDKVFNEDLILNEWVVVRNDSERKDFLSKSENIFDIMYFSIKDDIYLNIYNELLDIYDAYNKEWNKIVMSPIYLEGDILITDPCYWVKDEDWHELYFGNTWKHLGITKSICRDTLYGDWKCNIFNTNTNENLGEFCADSGMVCVCLLDEVLSYSKDKIKPYIENNSAAIIKDFKGTVQFKIIDNSLYIIGNGNINFTSKQTGL